MVFVLFVKLCYNSICASSSNAIGLTIKVDFKIAKENMVYACDNHRFVSFTENEIFLRIEDTFCIEDISSSNS